MLDMIKLNTDLEPNKEFIENQISDNPKVRFECNVNNYERFIKFLNKENEVIIKLFLNKRWNFYKNYKHSIELNPSRLNGAENLYALLVLLFKGFDPKRFMVSRLDLKADINIPFQEVLQSTFRTHITDFIVFTHENGIPSSIILGKEPIQAKIYNKTLERSQNRKTVSHSSQNSEAIETTRFEVKLLRESNKRFPIADLSEIKELLNFNAFKHYKFLKFKNLTSNTPSVILKTRTLQELARHPQIGSMQAAILFARRELNIRPSQHHRYFKEKEMPDLFQIYRDDLYIWFNAPYKSQTISGVKL